MDPNPYSAPKASVADPALVPVERPRIVTRAVQLLWVSYVLSLIASLVQVEVHTLSPSTIEIPGFVTVIANVIQFCFVAWIIYKLARGRRWARIVYLAFAVLGYLILPLVWQQYAADFAREPFIGLLLIAAAVAEIVALYWLFTKPANRWFAEPMRPANPL